jgi:hypothetical protein
MKFHFPLVAAAALTLAAPASAEGWNFIVSPFVMGPNMDGKAALGPLDTRVSASAIEVFRNLNWGLMGSLEANNDNWGFNFEGIYMNVDMTPDALTRLRVDGHQGSYTGTVLKRVHENAWVYAGVRYTSMGVNFGCQTQCLPNGGINIPGGITVPEINTRRSEDWVEGLVGFRAELPFNDNLDLTFNADAGGFGEGSDITINAWPQLGFRLGGASKLMLGYRLIYVKYENNEGPRPFLYDVLSFGPTLGFEFRF